MSKKAAKEVWGATPTGSTHAMGETPGTKEFFDMAYAARKDKEIRSVLELVPWESFEDKKVLEVGTGPGYDAYAFCKAGANYHGIDITPENVERTKSHLAYYDFSPEVQEGDAENLPYDDSSFDVVFSNGVLHHTPDMKKSFEEANRVLRDEGEFWVILYNRNSFFYWVTVVLFGHVLNGGFLKRSLSERLSEIEYTESESKPLVNVYTRKEVKVLLNQTGFNVDKMWVRKITQDDLPAIIGMGVLWNLVPGWLKRVAEKKVGWYIITKAVANKK